MTSDFPTPFETGRAYDKIAGWFRARMDGSPYGMDYLTDFMALLPRGGEILEFGCGCGRQTRVLLAHGFRVTGLDVSEEMLRFAREDAPGADYLLADASRFDSGKSFDAVLAWDSVFHLPPERHLPMLHGLSRLLKPGGIVLLTSGMTRGCCSGPMNGILLEYSSLSREDYREFFDSAQFEILRMEEDQAPEEHLVTLARYLRTEVPARTK